VTAPATQRADDLRLDQVLGRLLQLGVIVAAAVVITGVVLLAVHTPRPALAVSPFRSEPAALRSIGGIAVLAFHGDPAAVIQFGLLLLIATPIARVAMMLLDFALRRDRTYIAITAVVLAALLYGALS
jgi:uncharacterized membrane protein